MAHVYDMDCELGCKLLKVEKDKLGALKAHLLKFPSLAMEILDKDEWMRSAEDWKNKQGEILEAEA